MFIYKPNVAIIPGKTLANLLAKENLNNKDLAFKTGLTEKHISNIIQGKASITETTAIKFEYVFGGSASFWINLQKKYDEEVARFAFEEQLTQELSFVKLFPTKELASFNFISKVTKPVEKLKELLKFFGAASLLQIKSTQAVAYHQTSVKGKIIDQNAVAAWLQIGEIKYKKISQDKQIPPYNESDFKKSILEIKKLTRHKDFFNKLPDILLNRGVVLIDSPYLPKTYISGALRWIGGHPVVQINDHLKNKDSLYFTIFHEFAHIVLHDKREEYIDYEGKDEGKDTEKEANEWACETLISQSDYDKFLKQNGISLQSIDKFSKELEISKDIIVGRLAYDGKIGWQDRAKLVGKVSYHS